MKNEKPSTILILQKKKKKEKFVMKSVKEGMIVIRSLYSSRTNHTGGRKRIKPDRVSLTGFGERKILHRS